MDDISIAGLIPRDHILAEMGASSKDEALQECAKLLSLGLGATLEEPILEALQQRERLASTGIGGQVAIPHGKLDEIPRMVGALARSRDGIDFGAVDGQTTRLFFVIVAPGRSNGLHLRALARIARLCKDQTFARRLLDASEPAEMFEVLQEADGATGKA